jgi:hypothetical protein
VIGGRNSAVRGTAGASGALHRAPGTLLPVGLFPFLAATASFGTRSQRLSEGAARRCLFGRALLGCFLILASLLGESALAQTAPGTLIDNTARVEFGAGARLTRLSQTVSFETEAPPPPILGDPPTAIVLETERLVEDRPGAEVGRLTVLDPDVDDVHVFAVDDPRFEVVDGVLRLRPDASIDFETEPLVAVRVTATDPEGLSVEEAFAIVVVDRAEFTPFQCADAPAAPASDRPLLCENAPGALVGTLASAAGQDVITFDDPRFITDTGGRIRLRSDVALDFEAEPTLTLVVTFSSEGSPVDTLSLEIDVADLNEAPRISVDPELGVAAGEAGADAGALTAADPDAGDEVTLTLNDARFEVVGGRLRLREGEALEGGPVALRVTATDAAGAVTTRDLSVAVRPRNAAPVVEDRVTGVARGAATGTVIDRVRATDANLDDVLRYEIVAGNDTGGFAIDAATGVVTVASVDAVAEDGAEFLLRIRVTDDNSVGDVAGPRFGEGDLRLRVTGSNSAPVAVDQPLPGLDEHAPAGTPAGSLIASDPDQPLRWALVGGDPRGAFLLDEVTGVLSVARPEALDFETQEVFTLDVAVTDAGAVPLTTLLRVEVPLRDRNEAPVLADSVFDLPEDAPVGTVLGNLMASDPDAGDRLTWEIVAGDDAGQFALDPLSGILSLVDRSGLDHETTPVVTLRVRVTDANAPGTAEGRLSAEAIVTLRIGDVAEAPRDLRLSNLQVPAGQAGAVVGTLTVIDDDRDDRHS